MTKKHSEKLGILPISKLLIQQAVPASIGILVMSLNILVDSIFVGNWIGPLAIAAINVVLPISFFIAAIGMAIGIGGSSVLSRALGANNYKKAITVFGNQTALTLLITLTLITFGLTFTDSLVNAFGGKGDIFSLAKQYYTIILYGVPILALSMIHVLDWGMIGAGWATTISYCFCFLAILYFFIFKSELRLQLRYLKFEVPILKEISALGSITLARQGVISIVYLILNNVMVDLEGE